MTVHTRWAGGDDPVAPTFEHLEGIPARDLTDEDYAALTTEQKAVVRKSSLYVREDTDTTAKKATVHRGAASGGKAASGAVSDDALDLPTDPVLQQER